MLIYFLFLTLSGTLLCMDRAASLPHVDTSFNLSTHIYEILRPFMIKSETSAEIHIMGLGTYPLTQQMAQRLAGLDEKINKETTGAPGKHPVSSFQGVHFKVNAQGPALKPGKEFCLYSLLEIVLGMTDILAPTHLIILKNVIAPTGKRAFVVQASRSMGERSLKEFVAPIDAIRGHASFKDADKHDASKAQIKKIYDRVNPRSLTAHIIRSILTKPADDKDDNIRVQLIGEQDHFVGIDNDEDDAVPVYRERVGKYKNLHFVGVRSMIYLMKELMDKQCDSSIVERICAEKNLDQLIVQWLNRIDAKNQEYLKLVADGHLTKEELEALSLPISVRSGEVTDILHALKAIQHTFKKNSQVTHQQLVDLVQPLVGRYYGQLAKGAKSFEEAYRIVLNDALTPVSYTLEEVLDQHQLVHGEPTYCALRKENKSIDAHMDCPRITIEQAREELKRATFQERALESKGTELISKIEDLSNSEDQILKELPQFIQAGGNIHARDQSENSALDAAFKRRFKRLICELVTRGAGKQFKVNRGIECYNELERNKQLDEPTLQAFDLLESYNTEFAFSKLIGTVLSTESLPGGRTVRTTICNQPLYLSKEQCETLWNEDGTLKRVNEYGRKDSNYLTDKRGRKLFFKHLPHLVGYDYCISSLNRRAIGTGTTWVDLARINDQPYRLSLGIEGENLEDDFKKQENISSLQNPPSLKDLDSESTHKSILMAMVADIEDGKPDNYIVEKMPNGKKRLVCIDGESAFFPPLAQKNGKIERQTKCILFCLDEMEQAIPESVRTFFKNINTYELFVDWLKDVEGFESACFMPELFKNPQLRARFWNNEKDGKKSFIGTPMGPLMVTRLYEKFVKIQQALAKPEVVTPFDVLHETESPLEGEYGAAFASPMTVYQRFKMVDYPLFNKVTTKEGREIAASTAKPTEVLTTQAVPHLDTIVDIINRGEEIGPLAALKELESIAKSVEQQSKADIIEALKECKSGPEVESLVRKTDFALVPQATQNAFFEKLLTKRVPDKPINWRELRIRNARFFNIQTFVGLQLMYLQKLNISGCPSINLVAINTLSQSPWLQSLNISGNTELQTLEQPGFFGGPSVFPALIKLVANRCPRLTKLYLQAPLMHLSAQQCTNLVSLTLTKPEKSALRTLREADLRGNIALTDKAFEEFVATAPSLNRAHLRGCTKITYPEIRELSPRYPVSLYANASPDLREKILLLLKNDQRLTSVHLGVNACNDPQLQAICSALWVNTIVKSLHLDSNRDITDKGMYYIKELLEKNPSLSILDLGDTRATSHGLPILQQALALHPNLTELDLCTSTRDTAKKELDIAQGHRLLGTFSRARQSALLQAIQVAKSS